MRPFASGGLSPVAAAQLAAWEHIARAWATVAEPDPDTGARLERCASCWQGIYRLTDDHGKPYVWTDEEKLVMVVAHLRQSHAYLDPDPADIGR